MKRDPFISVWYGCMNVNIWNLGLEAAMQLLSSDHSMYLKLLPFSWFLSQLVFWITFADLFQMCVYSCENRDLHSTVLYSLSDKL